MLIRGDRLDVVNADGPNAVATIVGQPAHFEGRGLGLTGANINVNARHEPSVDRRPRPDGHH